MVHSSGFHYILYPYIMYFLNANAYYSPGPFPLSLELPLILGCFYVFFIFKGPLTFAGLLEGVSYRSTGLKPSSTLLNKEPPPRKPLTAYTS